MADLDEEFQLFVDAITEGRANFSEDEQTIIDSWVQKLLEPKDTDDDKKTRNAYARTLVKLVNEEKQLVPPFSEVPPEEDLQPLPESGKAKKYSFQLKKMPCQRPKSSQGTGAIPKHKKRDRSQQIIDTLPINEFEDPEEMARVIARSKGQSFAEFVVSIARYTSDYGHELRAAMNAETSSFREYVDNVLSQRVKDLTEVLDKEQNRELLRIKKDLERWQMELSLVKKRIKEMVPLFDIELYRKDRHYLKRIFTIDTTHGMSQDDSFQRKKEENCLRLKWISEMTCKVARCNEQLGQEITNVKSDTVEMEAREAIKQQGHIKYINCEINEYQKLKAERDRLNKENADILAQLQELGN